jgi:hypothetical protein
MRRVAKRAGGAREENGGGTKTGGLGKISVFALCYFNVQETTNHGTEIVVSEIVPSFAITSYVIMNAWSIASSSKHPEAAMKLLNMVYSGIENREHR